MKVLTFTVKGDFARFRIPYTTTSALSYSLIHPIAIKGLIGAIMGIDYKDLFEYTEGMEVGIQVLNPLNKDTQSFNLVPQTGANNSPNFQSRVEFLRNVKYRIFLSSTDEKLKKIENVMKERSFQFTPYLGASEHIARIEFENVSDAIKVNGENKVDTVILKDMIDDISPDQSIYFDRIPTRNSNTREYKKYEKVAFVINDTITINNENLYKVGDFNVYFL